MFDARCFDRYNSWHTETNVRGWTNGKRSVHTRGPIVLERKIEDDFRLPGPFYWFLRPILLLFKGQNRNSTSLGDSSNGHRLLNPVSTSLWSIDFYFEFACAKHSYPYRNLYHSPMYQKSSLLFVPQTFFIKGSPSCQFLILTIKSKVYRRYVSRNLTYHWKQVTERHSFIVNLNE